MTNLYCPKGHLVQSYTTYLIPHQSEFSSVYWCWKCDREYLKRDCLTEEQLKSIPSESENCSRCYNSGYEMGYEDGKTEDSSGVPTTSKTEPVEQEHKCTTCGWELNLDNLCFNPGCLQGSINMSLRHIHKNPDSYTHVEDVHRKEGKCEFDLLHQTALPRSFNPDFYANAYCKTHQSWDCDSLAKEFKKSKEKQECEHDFSIDDKLEFCHCRKCDAVNPRVPDWHDPKNFKSQSQIAIEKIIGALESSIPKHQGNNVWVLDVRDFLKKLKEINDVCTS